MKLTLTKPQETIRSAVRKYVEFLAPTYGPAGKKILIVKGEFAHEAVDDGKRSSESFEIENEFENAVVQYIKETTQKGKDGTTTAVLIMGKIVSKALKPDPNIVEELGNTDYHGMAVSLRKGLDEAVKKIQKASKQIKTKDELYAVAYNSYKNPEIAELIADTVFKIGKDGVMAIEDSQTTQTTVEIVNGLELNRGYASPYFINTDKNEEVVLKDPQFLLVNKRLNTLAEILPVFLATNSQGQKTFGVPTPVIIAEGFGEDILNRFIILKATGQLTPLLIETPNSANKLELLRDIGAIVGATVIDEKVLTLEKATKDVLGSANSVITTKDKTKIIGGIGKKGDLKDYIEKLRAINPQTNQEKDEQARRIAQLSGGIAVLKLGAYTDNELKAKKTKVENAVNSAQLAFRSGVVAGAGKTFLEVKTSSELLNEALKAPREQLEENGMKYLDEATTDPTEVVITALTVAISIAEGLITMGGISVPKRKYDDHGNPL